VCEEIQKCLPCDGMGYSKNKTSFDSGVFGSSSSTVPSSGPIMTPGPTTFGSFDGSFTDTFFDTLVIGGPPAADGYSSCSALWLEFDESYHILNIDGCAKLKKECIICDEMTNITNITYTNNTNASADTASFDMDSGPNVEDNTEI
jgi:hypothetical protein